MSLAASTSRNPGTAYNASLKEKLVAGDANAFDIYCPLEGCRCLLLRKGHAKLVQRNSEALHHSSAKPTKHPNEKFPLESASGAEDEQDCWLVTSPLTFENIGFTKGVVSNNAAGAAERAIASLPEGANVRYLSCADCDCGPLGWHVEHKGHDLGRDVEEQIGGRSTDTSGPVREFLIPLERCRYKLE